MEPFDDFDDDTTGTTFRDVLRTRVPKGMSSSMITSTCCFATESAAPFASAGSAYSASASFNAPFNSCSAAASSG